MKVIKNELEKLETNQLLNLAKFIVSENFNHHSNRSLPREYNQEIQSIYRDEFKYFNRSQIFVAKDNLGLIVGSIRVLKWNHIDLLPIQKLFGIYPLVNIDFNNADNIWHIGRFAIKRQVNNINLLKKMMVCAIAPICKKNNGIAFAECDSKLLKVLTLLGIKSVVLGESINYLGSETIPIRMDYYGLIDFYNKYKYLQIK